LSWPATTSQAIERNVNQRRAAWLPTNRAASHVVHHQAAAVDDTGCGSPR
jgi:hypothetical protein